MGFYGVVKTRHRVKTCSERSGGGGGWRRGRDGRRGHMGLVWSTRRGSGCLKKMRGLGG